MKNSNRAEIANRIKQGTEAKTMTLAEYLKVNKGPVSNLRVRRAGTRRMRRVEVPQHNHRDVWVWFEHADRVEARIDRRTGVDSGNGHSADDYEVVK